MRYFKLKKMVTEFTTLSLLTDDNETSIIYAEEGNCQIVGVITDCENFIGKQYKECEVEELTFTDVELILQECRLMKDFDAIIEGRIAEKYSIGKELKMRDLPEYDQQRIVYEEFKQNIKDEIKLGKQEHGLLVK